VGMTGTFASQSAS